MKSYLRKNHLFPKILVDLSRSSFCYVFFLLFRESIMNKCFYKKAVFKYFAIFTEKHVCWSLFLNKNACLQSWNFIKKSLRRRCFPVKFPVKLSSLKNICERLFLSIFSEYSCKITYFVRPISCLLFVTILIFLLLQKIFMWRWEGLS